MVAPPEPPNRPEVAGCCGCDVVNRLGVEFAPPGFENNDGCFGGCDALLAPSMLKEGMVVDCGCVVFGLPKSELVGPAAEVAGAPKREVVALG